MRAVILVHFFLFFGVMASAFGDREEEKKEREEEERPETFVLSSSSWTGPNRSFEMNGKSMDLQKIFLKLRSRKIQPGDALRIRFNDIEELDPGENRAYSRSGVLLSWIRRGGKLEMWLKDKKLNMHTVTCKDYMKGGDFVRKLDQLTVVFDGKPVGKGDAALKFVRAQKWAGNPLVIVVLDPYQQSQRSVCRPHEFLDEIKAIKPSVIFDSVMNLDDGYFGNEAYR